MYQSDYDRRLAAVMAAYERKVHDLVEPKLRARFETIQPGDEIPIIGDTFPDYELLLKEPYHQDVQMLIDAGKLAPPKLPSKAEYCERLLGSIMRAICAREWFRYEAPRWAGKLPLTEDDIIACFNPPYDRDRRRGLVGQYGRVLRGAAWHLENVPRFEVHCADIMRPPGFWKQERRAR
jgi:hypothetical protein